MAEFAAYVMYVNRPDLMNRALKSFPELWDELTIIDNSVGGIPEEVALPGRVFRPPVPLTWSQAANWMLADAERKGVDFIIHFHSDAASSSPTAIAELLDYARKVKLEGRKWGCLWTLYDVLWCINPVAVRDIGGWDTTFPDYFVDQDTRRRWNLAGWETIDTCIEGIIHEGSATIKSDERLAFINGMTFPHYAQLYRQKWAGDPGQEKYDCPFGRSDLFS